MAHGGRREGSGRKPGARAVVLRARAEDILAAIDEKRIWESLLRSRNERIRLETMRYLTDRRDGKPVQAADGPVRVPDFRNLPTIELRRYIDAARESLSPAKRLAFDESRIGRKLLGSGDRGDAE